MSKEDQEEDVPAVELDYHIVGEDKMATSVVIRDPRGMRKVVELNAAWVPAYQPGGPQEEWPEEAIKCHDPETLERLVGDGVLDHGLLPVMIIRSSSPIDDEEEEAMVYVMSPDAASNMLAGAVRLFVRNDHQVELLMDMLGHIIQAMSGGDDDDE